MQNFVTRNFLAVGIIANVVVIAVASSWAFEKDLSTGSSHNTGRSVQTLSHGVSVNPIAPVETGNINPSLRALPVGKWVKIHQQVEDEIESFSRQTHGGAAFDPVRGRLMLFGSDTHRKNWDNAVRFFDMGALHWSAAYLPDSSHTYRVNERGIPVAGEEVERPWAMHTFDAVEFDPVSDRLIVASHPSHLSPKKKWGVDKKLWEKIRNHPTWIYHVSENRWEPLGGKGISFFAYGATFDPIRRAVIGVKPDGYWELAADSIEWQHLAKGTPYAWHNSSAYDSHHDIVVSFGTNNRANSIWQYRRGDELGKEMQTAGIRPRGVDSPPLVYYPDIRRVVALVEHRSEGGLGTTETWIYSTQEDSWSRVETATLPFEIGMNYDMVYDPGHKLLVLVTNAPGRPVAVWALRLGV